MFKKSAVLLLSFLVLFAAPLCFAQEMESMDEMLEFTFGTVVRVSNEDVTIMEYNFEQEKELEETYAVTPATEFINIGSLADLKIGEEIEIEFKATDGQRVAMAIAKDEEMPMDDMEEMGEMETTDDVNDEATE